MRSSSLGLRFLSASLLALALLGASSRARADEAPPPTEKPEEKEDRRVYLSFSPVHAIFITTAEVTGEVRVHRKIGVAGIAGFGRPSVLGTRFTVWELGGQLVTYPVGHFDHGMQLGVEALYAGVSADDASFLGQRVSGVGEGFSVGPMIGYKLATEIGFSFNIQGGVAYQTASARASSGSGTTSSRSDAQVAPILNLNLGWSL